MEKERISLMKNRSNFLKSLVLNERMSTEYSRKASLVDMGMPKDHLSCSTAKLAKEIGVILKNSDGGKNRKSSMTMPIHSRQVS
jgi:hypothetical protein